MLSVRQVDLTDNKSENCVISKNPLKLHTKPHLTQHTHALRTQIIIPIEVVWYGQFNTIFFISRVIWLTGYPKRSWSQKQSHTRLRLPYKIGLLTWNYPLSRCPKRKTARFCWEIHGSSNLNIFSLSKILNIFP